MKNNINFRNLTRVMIPEGMLVPRAALMEGFYNRHILDNLVKSGQLESVASGVYGKPPIELTWQSVVCSLQTRFKLDVVVGGLSALELQGYGHYLSLKRPTQIHLYASNPLPRWLDDLIDGVDFVAHSNQQLAGKANNDFAAQNLTAFTTMYPWREGRPSLIISGVERAFLELLAEVPKKITFNHAYTLMQSMTTLSPDRLQTLLENCGNIKVRRLFFFMAERHKWSWLKKLDQSKIDFGSGNRVIEKGGRLDKKYKITVPKDI